MYAGEGPKCMTNDMPGEERLAWGQGPRFPQFCPLLGTWGFPPCPPPVPGPCLRSFLAAWTLEVECRQSLNLSTTAMEPWVLLRELEISPN